MELMGRSNAPRRALMALVAALIVLLAGVAWSEKGTKMTSHLTIYIALPVATQGGLVIVSALPIPREDWEKLPVTDSVAMWDETNGKQQQLVSGDKHYGVVITSRAAAVELLYPEDGTYTFNFLKTPTDESTALLTTERISVGTGSSMPNPSGGPQMEWPSMSTIAVIGTEGGMQAARTLEPQFFDLTGPENFRYYRVGPYAGGRLIELTDAAIAKLLKEGVE